MNDRDWDLFQEKVDGWQEAYIDRLNKEYIAILSDPAKSAAERS